MEGLLARDMIGETSVELQTGVFNMRVTCWSPTS